MLLAAMRLHRMRPLVQQHAASAIQNLAGNHATNKCRIAEEGGIQLLISSMMNHPQEIQVQRYASSALKNLSSDNGENKLIIARSGQFKLKEKERKREERKERETLLEAPFSQCYVSLLSGGVDALLAALKTHRNNAEVQQYAAGALQNISANNCTSRGIYGSKGQNIRELTRMLSSFSSSSSSSSCSSSFFLFFFLCWGFLPAYPKPPAFTKAEVIRLGGIAALEQSREAFAHNTVVCQSLESALRVLKS